jgi:hypothetical protein
VLGVLAYLFLPGLHAFHGVVPERGTLAVAQDVHHGHERAHHHLHAHTHEGSANRESPAEPCHDPASCEVCRVYFATTSGADIPAPIVVCFPVERHAECAEMESQLAVVSEACPSRSLRGPPC